LNLDHLREIFSPLPSAEAVSRSSASLLPASPPLLFLSSRRPSYGAAIPPSAGKRFATRAVLSLCSPLTPIPISSCKRRGDAHVRRIFFFPSRDFFFFPRIQGKETPLLLFKSPSPIYPPSAFPPE